MIQTIKVRNHDRVAETVLSLTNPWDTGLVITKIDGLGPPKATINTTELASQPGSTLNSAKITNRNIVINFAIIDVIQNGAVEKTIEEVRHDVYKIFTPMTKITMTIATDYKTYMVDGYVESCDPDIFSKNETLVVSIICTEPFLYEKSNSFSLTTGIYENLFEFPFSNESLNQSLINMGELADETSESKKVINYLGDVETGFSLVIRYQGQPRGNYLRVSNLTTEKQFEINWSKVNTMPNSGSILMISTIVGMKGAWLNGSSILDRIASNVDWFSLIPGKNSISVADIEDVLSMSSGGQMVHKLNSYSLSNATATIDVLNRFVGV